MTGKRGNMLIRDQIRRDLSVVISNFKFPISNEEIEVTRTIDSKFGDFSTNVVLKIAKTANGKPLTGNRSKQIAVSGKQSPVETAKILTDSLKDLPYVEKLEVAGPGFINFFIKNEYWQKQVNDVLGLNNKYGSNDKAEGKKARVEYVSANPTGPLHFGNARGGPIGDVLASVLGFCGYEVLREYYHNDIGEQIRKLGESIINVASGKTIEDQEYKGIYIKDLGEKIRNSKFEIRNSEYVGKEAVKILFEEIMGDCRDMGITYDQGYSEI